MASYSSPFRPECCQLRRTAGQRCKSPKGMRRVATLLLERSRWPSARPVTTQHSDGGTGDAMALARYCVDRFTVTCVQPLAGLALVAGRYRHRRSIATCCVCRRVATGGCQYCAVCGEHRHRMALDSTVAAASMRSSQARFSITDNAPMRRPPSQSQLSLQRQLVMSISVARWVTLFFSSVEQYWCRLHASGCSFETDRCFHSMAMGAHRENGFMSPPRCGLLSAPAVAGIASSIAERIFGVGAARHRLPLHRSRNSVCDSAGGPRWFMPTAGSTVEPGVQ